MTKYRFTSTALSELTEATLQYEQKENGLGAIFLDEIDAAVERVLRFPRAWHPMFARTRRCRTHRFPFGLLYQIRSDEILITAVMDLASRSATVERIALTMNENRLSSISKADSDEKIGEFWDTHDFTEFDTNAPDAEFELVSTVPRGTAWREGRAFVNQCLPQKLDDEASYDDNASELFVKSKHQVVAQTPTKKPAKADVSDAEFRRRLKNISEWRKKRLTNN